MDPLLDVHTQLKKNGKFNNNSTISIHAAVSNQTGIMPFFNYARQGVASSLAPAKKDIIAKEKYGTGAYTTHTSVSLVPVITLRDILHAIPPHVRILQLKTDMQGFDFTAIVAAGTSLRRVERIYNECLGPTENDIYENVDNRFLSYQPRMLGLGFSIVGYRQNNPKHDCTWVRTDLIGSDGSIEHMDDLPCLGPSRIRPKWTNCKLKDFV